MREKLLTNGLVINLDPNCKEEYEKKNIFIDKNGIIKEITSSEMTLQPDVEIIDCHEKYIMPGLINIHSHLFSSGKPLNLSFGKNTMNLGYRLLKTTLGNKIIRKIMHKNAQTQLESGITTIRSVGEFFYQDVWLRDQYKQKKLIGPTLLVSGFFLSITDGHGAPYLALESDSPWEGKKNVRKNMKQGVDWIKVCITGGVTDARRVGEAGALQFTLEEVTSICEEAHKNHVMVAAHVESTEGVRIALKAGIDTIEHGAPMDDEIKSLYKNNPNSLRGYTALVPTFQAAAPFALLDPKETGLSVITFENGKIVYEGMVESFKQAITEGIVTGVGNDASMSFVTHYDFWRELDHQFHYAQLTKKQVLYNATRKNAEIIGVEQEYGSIEKGKKADLLILNDNPVNDLQALKKIHKIFKDGQEVKIKPIKKFDKMDRLLDKI